MKIDIKEILKYLEPREDYVIWAGFAQYAHLGIKPSLDVDIFTQSIKVKKQISSDLQKMGWKKVPCNDFYKFHDKLENAGTTFDIIYSKLQHNYFLKKEQN